MDAPSHDFRNLYFRTLVVIAAFATAAAIYYLRHILFLVFLALLVSVFLAYFSRPLERKLKFPRWLAPLVVAVGLILLFSLLGYILISPFANQVASLVDKLPDFIDKVRSQLTFWLAELGDWAPQIQPEKLAQEAAKYAGNAVSKVIGVLSGGVALVTDAITVLVIGIFLAIERRRVLNAFTRLFRNRTTEEMSELASRGIGLLQGWILGQITAMFFLGTFSTVAYWIAGVDYFLVFGTLAALFSVIPYLGPVLTALGPLIWCIFAEPSKIIWVLVIWAAAQALEGNLITPLIMHRYVKLSPLAVILGILVMGSLFGFIGIVVAVPLTAVAFLLLGEVFPWWKEKVHLSLPVDSEE